jgi:PAS domain S-box-containing protein
MQEEGKTRAQLVNELQVMRQRITELETLQRTNLLLTSSLDLSTVLDSIAESALALVGASDCLIYLYDGASERFSFGTALGKQSADGSVRAPRRNGLTATVVREGRPVVINDAVGHPLYASPEVQQWNIQAVAGFPLQRAGRVVGVLHVVFGEPHTFCEDDLRVLSLLADQAATAIDNSQLYAQAQQEIAERVRTEEALRRLQALNEGIVQNTAEGIVVDDADGNFSFVNPAAAALLGYEVEELVGQHWTLVIPPDQQPIAQAANERRARGQADRYEIQLIRKDGTRVPVQVSGSPRFDANTGRFAGTLAVFTDLAERVRVEKELRRHRDHLEELVNERTAALREANAQLQREVGERKRAEAELREYHEHLEDLVEERTAELRKSEERYRTLFDGVPMGLYRTTPAGQIVDANLSQVQMMGYPSREDLLAVDVVDLYVHPEDRTRLRDLVERQEVLRDFEAQLHRYDGAMIWASLTLRAVKDEQGQVLYYEGSLEDITERKQAEKELRKYQEHLEELVQERTAELRESEERYRTLFDGVPVGLYRTTPRGQIVDANLAFVQMLDFPSREDLLAINPVSYYVNPREHERWQALMEREGIVRDFEAQVYRYDHTAIWIRDTARTVRDERGQVLYYEGSAEDISKRKQAEAELRKYQGHLEELVEERTAELRGSEERYRTLFDGVPVGLYRSTPDGQIVDANLALVQMLSYPSREEYLTVDSANVYVAPTERVRWQALMEREGVVRDFEAQARRYDGTVIWVNDTARAVKDEQGQILYYEGSLEDITERKQAEQELRKYQEHLEELVQERTAELRESEERYRTLFDGVPVGLYRTTPTGQVVDANLAAVQMLGFPTKEATLASNTADLYVNPEGHARWTALMEQEGVVRDFEYQIRRPDGRVIWISDTARTVRDGRGQVLYYEGSLEDITERKRLEEESRRQKDYFEALFVNSPVAVVTVDLDANVVAWNPAAEKLFGYTQNEAIGKNVDDLVANDPSVRDEALSYTTQAITLGRVQATTKRTRKDGSLVDVEVLSMPVIVAGEEVGFIAMYPDIGELEQARREAEAANQAKSTFLANMSHELRTPLNAILGFTQLMGGDPNLTIDQQENLEIINQSGEHLLVLINDVLEMSKIEAGRVTLQEKSFDLHRLLGGLEEMFGLRAEEKGLALRFERAEAVPQYVRTDEGKLRQVLSNLLGNAIKFTQKGSVTLGVSSTEYKVGSKDDSLPLLPASRPYSLLHFQVQDTGPGIAPEDLEAVFDPFVQASSGQRFQEGTGLGLSISREYARLLGGDVTVRSELGQGSVFAFDVRVGLDPDGAVEAQAAQPTRQVVGLEPDQTTYRLLVAEDRDANRRLLVKLLGDLGSPPLGFEVREATNGREAIEIWERWEPHLIWMDLRMPVVDGHEAIRQIKATDRGQDTIIIALTASAFEEDRERVLTEGCDDFVRKPFRKSEIYGVLARHLGVRFVYQESEEQGLRTGERDKDGQASSLTTMPAEWLADLRQATIRANSNQILALVDQIREQNPALADTLAELVHDFEYKRILTLIEQAGGQR